MLGPELLELLKTAVIELANIFNTFNRPLKVFWRLVVLFFRLHLIGEADDVPNGQAACLQLVADLQEFRDCDRRACDCLLRTVLSPLNPFRDGYLLIAREQRHPTHFAHVKPHRICALIKLTGRKIQRYVLSRRFTILIARSSR